MVRGGGGEFPPVRGITNFTGGGGGGGAAARGGGDHHVGGGGGGGLSGEGNLRSDFDNLNLFQN